MMKAQVKINKLLFYLICFLRDFLARAAPSPSSIGCSGYVIASHPGAFSWFLARGLSGG